MHTRTLAILLVLVAFGAAACGSSSKGASGATTTSTAGSGSTPTAGGGTTTTGAPTTTGKVSGDSNSTFCEAVRGDLGAFKGTNFTGSTPTDLKKLYSNLKGTLNDAESIAPSAIKPDFQTFVTAFTPILNTLAQYNYDFSKIPPSAYAGFQSMDTPAIKAASAHIEAYVEQVCHVSPTSTP